MSTSDNCSCKGVGCDKCLPPMVAIGPDQIMAETIAASLMFGLGNKLETIMLTLAMLSKAPSIVVAACRCGVNNTDVVESEASLRMFTSKEHIDVVLEFLEKLQKLAEKREGNAFDHITAEALGEKLMNRSAI